MRILVYVFLFTTASFAQEAKKSGEPRVNQENETGGRPLFYTLPLGSSSIGNQVDISTIRDLVALLSSKNPSALRSIGNEVSQSSQRSGAPNNKLLSLISNLVGNSRLKPSVEVPSANFRTSGGARWSAGLSAYNLDPVDVQSPPPTNRPYPVAVPKPVESDRQIPETGKNPSVPVFVLVPVPYRVEVPETSGNKVTNSEPVSLQSQEQVDEEEQTSDEEDEAEDVPQRVVRAQVGIPQSYVVRDQFGVPQTYVGRDQRGLPQTYVARARF